jgi:hypothetical protein
VIQNHPNRTVPDFRRKLVRGLAGHGSILSGVGASGKPGAVQSAGDAKGHRSMNQYLPWLLIIAGIFALAAVIYWRMTYVVSD